MAIPDNSDNASWNTIHSGNRIPVNDSDLEGNPTAQGSHEPSWADGAINRAVRSAWLGNGNTFTPEDQPDADAGKLDLVRLAKYIIPTLLYGYNGPNYIGGDGIHGDAWQKTPGDAMSFRGYPTVGVDILFQYVSQCSGCFDWNLDGSLGVVQGDYAYLRARTILNYKVSYDVIVDVLWEGITYQLKTTAGDLYPYLYTIKGSFTWNALPQGYMFFTVPKPIASTTYLLRIFDTVPELVYKNYVSPINLTIEPETVICQDWIWFFGPVVRTGGVSLVHTGDPIEAIYQDPDNAWREIQGLTATVHPGQLGQRRADLQPDQSFTNGFEMAMGDNHNDAFGCYTSYLNGDIITNQYLWIGTLTSVAGSDPVYLVDTIWKIDENDNLVDERQCTGPPYPETIPNYPTGINAEVL